MMFPTDPVKLPPAPPGWPWPDPNHTRITELEAENTRLRDLLYELMDWRCGIPGHAVATGCGVGFHVQKRLGFADHREASIAYFEWREARGEKVPEDWRIQVGSMTPRWTA